MAPIGPGDGSGRQADDELCLAQAVVVTNERDHEIPAHVLLNERARHVGLLVAL
jgi:hypothetical protein